jgi:hypothetical protein
MRTTVILNGGGESAPYAGIVSRVEAWSRGHGYAPVAFDLTRADIKPCSGCFNCWLKTPGLCSTRDAMAGILPRLAESDTWVFVTPVVYGGYGYHLKKALDRSIPVLLPFFVKVGGEVHHPLRYAYGRRRVAALGVLPEADPESERIFAEVLRRNAINMHAEPVAVVVHGTDGGRWEERLDGLFGREEVRS